jgi:hypothetical protein
MKKLAENDSEKKDKTVRNNDPNCPVVVRVVTQTITAKRTDGRSDDGRRGVRDLDAL